ncbi:FecR family protein [Bacteroides sp. 51]|uniref:FecR family protein n=1 Tax=Bacteroides sp. 51 TaxID=2302938 RepID=UPI0013D51B69|nr:FecR family protein [Bacteroides sp. 51]NDV83307.1 FecR family protein [Bacteroides sp. 51]
MDTRRLKIKPDWSKTKEEIWEEQFAGLDEHSPSTVVSKPVPYHRKQKWLYAVAAFIAIAILLPSTAYFYKKEVVTSRGEHISYVLPDGSTVKLNAESRLSYKPYWWKISREIKLNGEGYFEVTPGSTFQVNAGKSTVTVLGTSFNVYARKENYLNVTCLTGKVQVKRDHQTVVLTPNMQAQYQNNVLSAGNTNNSSNAIEWTRNHFVFLAAPLDEVVEEIERQYNIEVVTTSKLDYLYTGNFSKNKSPEEVLKIIGKPFGIEFKVKRVE